MKFVFLSFILSVTFSAQAVELDLEPYKGKIVYVDFWASWCAPCKLSFPWMAKMQAKYKDEGLVIITVNVDETKEEAAKFLKDFPQAKFPMIHDPDSKLVAKYKIEALPWSLIFDRQGKLTKQHRGFTTEKSKVFEKELEKIFN